MAGIKRVFITGASGFIGKNLKEYLSPKHKVFAPTHQQLELLNQSAVENFILRKSIDVVIHGAIIGGGKEDTALKNVASKNLRMFFNIVRNSKHVEKILYCGSGLEYDKSKPIVDVTENDFDQSVPPDDYGLYKYIAAKYIERSENIYDLVVFGIYGKYEGYLYKFISNAIVKNLIGMPIVIAQNVFFHYLYIDDFCRITNFFIRKKLEYKRYNIVPDRKIDLVTIARIINDISDNKSEIIVLNKNLNNEYTASNKRLRSEIKNVTFTDHKESIKKLYRWYKKNLKTIDIKRVKLEPHLRFIKREKTLYK